jgi:hypothetical protein
VIQSQFRGGLHVADSTDALLVAATNASKSTVRDRRNDRAM